MNISRERFSRDTLVSLSDSARESHLREFEALANLKLQSSSTLAEFQEILYAVIDELERIGHFLGRWDYDCEVEYWGGESYMNPAIEDELLLRSEFGRGIQLAWKNPAW